MPFAAHRINLQNAEKQTCAGADIADAAFARQRCKACLGAQHFHQSSRSN